MSNPILIMFNLALPLPGCGYCSHKSNILQEYTYIYTSLRNSDDFPAGAQNVWQR